MQPSQRNSQYLSSAESSAYFEAKMCHGTCDILTDATVRKYFYKTCYFLYHKYILMYPVLTLILYFSLSN